MTRLYYLKLTKGHPLKYDVMYSLVVRAESEEEAREIAASECAAEGYSYWKNKNLSACMELNHDGEKGLIVADVFEG